jgi:hypothetical protein
MHLSVTGEPPNRGPIEFRRDKILSNFPCGYKSYLTFLNCTCGGGDYETASYGRQQMALPRQPVLTFLNPIKIHIKKGKAISVTGRGGPLDCETSRRPHLLDNRLTDGSTVVSPTSRPPFTPGKIPGTHFC